METVSAASNGHTRIDMNERIEKWPAVVAAVMLVLAVLSWPYGYFQLLRVAIFGVSVYYLYTANKGGWELPNAWIAVILAILFNPFIPVHLTRGIWFFIDLGSAYYFYTVYQAITTSQRS